MCGTLIVVLLLSGLGATVVRAVSALLGVEARTVVGLHWRPADPPPSRSVALRGVPVWATTDLAASVSGPRAFAARASAPIAILLVPYVVAVSVAVVRGVDAPAESPFVVGTVVWASPAEDAGIAVGDTILEVAGHPVTDMHSLIAAEGDRAGLPTEVVIERGGVRHVLSVLPRLADEGRVVMGVTAGTRREEITTLAAMRAVVSVARASWWMLWLHPLSPGFGAPVGIIRSAERMTDGSLVVLHFALSAVTLSPLVALLSALGQVRRARARPARP